MELRREKQKERLLCYLLVDLILQRNLILLNNFISRFTPWKEMFKRIVFICYGHVKVHSF